MTEPSTYSTSECTIDCGCTTTCTCSGGTSNSHRASMTSSPLFMRVAESTVILAPIRQVGWFSASATVTRARSAAFMVRKGPPEAVSRMRRTSARLWPSRHWKTALCSESTGRSGDPALAGRRGHQAARHHERLLVGERHALAALDGGHRRQQTGAAHDGREDHVGLDLAGERHETRRSREQLGARQRAAPGPPRPSPTRSTTARARGR